MRIAVLGNAYPPEARGGAGRIAARQVELLQSAGHEVRVWTASLAWTQGTAWRRLLFHARDLVWVHPCVQEMRDWQPDVLLTHNLTGAGFRTPSSVRRWVKRAQGRALRWVHVLHDVQLFYPVGLLRDESHIPWLQRFVTFLRRRSFGIPDAVLSPTRWLLEAHTRRGWFLQSERHVIPNPAPARAKSFSNDWHVPLRLLYVGRVSRDKGATVLQEVLACTSGSWELRVIGSGSEVLDVGGRSQVGSLHLSPESTPQEVLQAMEGADILLVPSQIEENQPTVILEAFSQGLPVIGQTKGGIPETVGEAGICVREATGLAWLKAIEMMTKQSRGYWSARSIAAWERHAPERVLEVLCQVLKSNKKM